MRDSWFQASAVAVAAITTPLVAWWIVGDQSSTTLDPDSIVEPPAISASAELVIGIVATTLLVLSLAPLVVATRHRRLDARWWFVVLLLVGAGCIVGFSARIVTAGVIGANIGGGLVILFGGPIVLMLLAWAGARAASLLRRTRTEPVGG